jgi:hypothetical protein
MTDTDKPAAADIAENARTGYQVAVNLCSFSFTAWRCGNASVRAAQHAVGADR